jgi:hypothetical protein
MKRANPTVQKSGTLYVQVRKLPAVVDGYGTDSIEARVREHLLRAYAEITIGQPVPLSERPHNDLEVRRRIDRAYIDRHISDDLDRPGGYKGPQQESNIS